MSLPPRAGPAGCVVPVARSHAAPRHRAVAATFDAQAR
ncbi:hypothetical protein C7S17_5301 [Burkholderia thailandensis]|nr:hypothetical protein [Burkholderia thailandensis]